MQISFGHILPVSLLMLFDFVLVIGTPTFEILFAFFNRIQEKTAEQKEIQAQIALENMGQVNITVPQIKFFLSELKKGNINDIKYRKTLINTFVNAIYLFDDKMTIIFNSGDAPVTVDGELLADIERKSQVNECSINLNEAPPDFNDIVQTKSP